METDTPDEAAERLQRAAQGEALLRLQAEHGYLVRRTITLAAEVERLEAELAAAREAIDDVLDGDDRDRSVA